MQAFYNLRIATKLILTFIATLALTGVLGMFSILQLSKVNASTIDIATNWLPSTRVVIDMKSTFEHYSSLELQHILSNNDAFMVAYEKSMGETWNRLAAERAQHEKLISEPEEKAAYAELGKVLTLYAAQHDKMITFSRDLEKGKATEVMRGESHRLSGEIIKLLDTLVTINVEGSNKSAAGAEALYSSSKTWVGGLLAACIVLGLGMALWIARLVATPLKRAVELAESVAAGDLTSRIESTSKDETGMLLQALKAMNESLVKIVCEVRMGTDSITSATGQIAAGNADLSQRTEEQASSLEETASSMEELTSTVRQNADNARQANQLAAGASAVAVKGGAVVGQVVSTMSSINDSSKKIVDIIAVIDGIAFQTNILALNAAVEAARAGEQGRGFAVVASEVRSLAQRSAAAAKEIKGLITDSVGKVEDGTRLVGEAGKTMEEIVASVKRVTDIMAEIAAASQEQSSGIEQVNQAITQMDEVTQQNAALVEEAAAAAESLQEQAQSLTQAVSVFKLAQSESRVAVHTAPARTATVTPIKRRKPVDDRKAVDAASNIEAKKVANAKGDEAEWQEF